MQNSNDHKQMIQQGLDTVAAGYDHPSLSFFPETHDRQGWWKCWQCMEQLAVKRLVEHLQLNPTDNLLDVCTGTGCVALTTAEKLPQGKVTGIDLSSCMLQQTKNKAAKQGLKVYESGFAMMYVLLHDLTLLVRSIKPGFWVMIVLKSR